MEVKFHGENCRYLKGVADQIQTQEQTQEIRLPDAMPDIGRVLSCWGKIMVRSKEWHGNGMAVSGGVMAWALYVPDGENTPQCVEAWIPFQLKWDFPETETDGTILLEPVLRGIDARSISARKMMIRTTVAVRGQGLERTNCELFSGKEVPEDVQLLTNQYPMEIPWEAGEKLMQVDEEIPLSEIPHGVEKILRYDFTPVIHEKKIVASRVVFRGVGKIHMLYLSENVLHTYDAELPFSQFIDLEEEQSIGATVIMLPMLTNLELEKTEERLHLKAALAVQYIIYKRILVSVTEDAYSVRRQVTLIQQEFQLPAILEYRQESMDYQKDISLTVDRVVDSDCRFDAPRRQQNGENAQIVLGCAAQVLYYDISGNLQSGNARFEEVYTLPADNTTIVDCCVIGEKRPNAIADGDVLHVSGNAMLLITSRCNPQRTMVSGLEFGETVQADPMRPSLIICRFTGGDLWSLAKGSGSTVTAIRQANGLTDEPEFGRMLLIPVN